jgi:hypothetical protein
MDREAGKEEKKRCAGHDQNQQGAPLLKLTGHGVPRFENGKKNE